MAMAMRVDKFATLIGVTTKTIREYVRMGMPVVRAGDKGPGNGALIDVARALSWLKRNTRALGEMRTHETLADFLKAKPMEQRNPLRRSVELYHNGVIRMVSAALTGWHRDCAKDWRALGLTDAQVRTLVWKLFGAVALTVLKFKLDAFDDEVRQQSDGADLDDLASLYFQGDIQTEFIDAMEFPKTILPYAPPDLDARIAETRAEESKAS